MIYFIRKELQQYFSNKKVIFPLLLLPIILITLFAFAYGDIFGDGEAKFSPPVISYNDNDSSYLSKALTKRIQKSNYLQLNFNNDITGRKLVKLGKTALHISIPKGFSDSIHQGKDHGCNIVFDKTKPIATNVTRGVIKEVLYQLVDSVHSVQFQSHIHDLDDDKLLDEKVDLVNAYHKYKNHSRTIGVKSTAIQSNKKGNLGLIQSVAGMSIMMLLFSISKIGVSILEEKEKGTLDRIMVSPIQPSIMIYAKSITAFIIAMIQLLTMYLFAWIFFDLKILDHPILLLFILICTAFACSSLGIFLASISRSRIQVQFLSTIIILVMSALGGSMMPQFIMPSIMKSLSVISINYWGIQGVFDLFYRDVELSVFLYKCLILLIIGGVLNGIALLLLRRNILSLV